MIRWIAGTLIILALALVLQLGLLAYSMYALLGLIILSQFVIKHWTTHLGAKRNFNGVKELNIGDRAEVSVTVTNDGTLPIPWVLAEDFVPDSYIRQRPPRLQIEGKRQRISMVPAKGETSLKYIVTPMMRGFYQLGPMILEGGDLFGLDRRYRLAAPPQFLIVYPRTVPVIGYDLASRRPIGEIRLTHRLYEDPTRIAGVRSYEQGDPLNRVHWRTTARMGVLHSKVYEPSTIAGATILLDFHKASYHQRGEPYRSELAVTTAMSVAAAVHSLNQQFGFISNGQDAAERMRMEGWDTSQLDGDTSIASRFAAEEQAEKVNETGNWLRPVIVPPRRSEEQINLVREMLARLELSEGLRFPDLIDEASGYIPRDTTAIAILADVTPEHAIALGGLQRQGMAVVVILIIQDQDELEKSLLTLASENLEVRHVMDEPDISSVCQQQFIR